MLAWLIKRTLACMSTPKIMLQGDLLGRNISGVSVTRRCGLDSPYLHDCTKSVQFGRRV